MTPEYVGALRIMRLGRMLRLVRMIRLFPALKSMVILIADSMDAFFWSLMLLIMLMYALAVYLTDLLASHNEASKKNWGSLSVSMMSLYQAVSGGIDWQDLTDPI